jgi:hypothetical protein
MKTKITLLIGAVALVTLSFTFANVEKTARKDTQIHPTTSVSTPVGGLVSDEVAR